MKYPEDYINKVIQGDCLEVMRQMPDKCVDLVLTDPPYNAKNIGPNARVYEGQQMQLPPEEYISWCKTWFQELQRISHRIVLTPGIANVCAYPQPSWIACWHKPASCSFNRFGGFNAWEPILLYGKIPKGKRLPQDYILENTLNFTKGPEKDHPCPKPINLWMRLVDTFSLEDEIVFDPFNGGGTTTLACKNLNRRYIGVDLIEKYNQIAMDRLKQDMLF